MPAEVNLETGCGGMDWIYVAEDRDVWQTCDHDSESSGYIKCWEFLDTEGLLASQ
jgi:hypothetical protein